MGYLCCGRRRQPWVVLLRRLPVDWIRVIAEGLHCLERVVESWLRRLELLCLLDGPAGVPHKFGFLFSFHSFKRSFLFGALIGPVASIFPMKVTAAGLAEVRVLSLSLFHGLCWTCPFGCVLWSCYCLAPSWVEWKVGLCKGQILLADPCLTKVPYRFCRLVFV